LFSEPFDAVVHPDHRLASGAAILVGDLARDRILARPYCELYGAFDDLIKTIEVEAEGRHEVGSDDDLVRLVEANLGIGVLPRSTPSPGTVKRLPLDGLDISRTISLYGVSGRERSAPATALLKLLRARDWSATAA
jgi:DNA-binding transcriptional LysR family regulator